MFEIKTYDKSIEEGVVSICDSRHGVDLEVLVGAHGRHLLDGAPVSEGRLGVVEPLVAHVLHVVVVDVGHSLGDFRAGHAAVQVQHLGSNLLHDISCALDGHQLVVKSFATADDLNIVDVVAIDGGQAHTAVVHLASEHFVAEEPVTEDTAIAVRTVQALSSGNIDELTKESMHGVVLLLHIVDVLSVHVNLVVAEDSLQQQETVEVFVFPAWSIIEDTDRRVDHLIVTDHEQTRVEDGLLQVVDWAVRAAGQVREVLLITDRRAPKSLA